MEQRKTTKITTKRKNTFVVFFDFAKAFDSIDRQMLKEKLEKMNLSQYIVKILISSLINTSGYLANEEI